MKSVITRHTNRSQRTDWPTQVSASDAGGLQAPDTRAGSEVRRAIGAGKKDEIKNASVLILASILILLACSNARSQDLDTSNQFWPEADVYVKLNPKFRLFFLGTVSRAVEDGELIGSDAFECQFGAHFDYIPNKHVVLRIGYRFGRSLGDTDDPYTENRLITEQTFRKMIKGDVLLSDRNRQDFRWVNADFSFRYRNRLTIEREFGTFKGRTITPYASGEVYYDTRHGTWNRNRYAAGFQFPMLRRHAPLKMLFPDRDIVLDVYYMRQNDSKSSPRHVNAIGLAVNLYF